MKRVKFDSSGKISSIDNKTIHDFPAKKKKRKKSKLRTSDSLDFLKQEPDQPANWQTEEWASQTIQNPQSKIIDPH